MSLEFKWEKYNKYRRRVYEPVEVGDDFGVVLHDKSKRRKLVSNGRVAFEIISRGKLYDQLLLDYELKQRRQPKTTVQEAAPVVAVAEPVAVKEIFPERVADVAPRTVINEQAEVQEPYSLSSDDWFECVVDRVSRDGRQLILSLENATATCVSMKVTESPGSHSMACLVGLTGAVRLEIVGDVYRALELQVLGEPSVLREEASVVWWDPIKNIGKAKRISCGCHIFVGSYDIVYGEINVGDEIVFDLERSRSRGNWIGVRARKLLNGLEGQGASERN